MGKEEFVPTPEFVLNPLDIFQSAEVDGLNDYGMACQAIVLRQKAILEAKAKNWDTSIAGEFSREIVLLRTEHKIPEEALPILKVQFDRAVKQHYNARAQGISLQAQRKISASI